LPESTNSSLDAPLWAVVLAGGTGSRFWPVSLPVRPKQLLPLSGDRPLIAETLARVSPLLEPGHVRILTGARLAAPILKALPEISQEQLLVEPLARSTAPALAWAAHEIAARDPDAIMLSVHADHVINPAEAFRSLILELASLTREHRRLFTIGVAPTRPETCFGYIRVGQPLGTSSDVAEVAAFVEKPPRETAREYLLRGGYLWNTGIFVWRAQDLLDQLARHTPELAELMPLLAAGDVATFFEHAPDLSIDEGLLERSDRVAVARATFEWDDVGGWDALGRVRPTDPAGNVAVGDAHLVESQECVTWAEDGAIVLFGARDLVVVRAHGITFVAPRERTAELKALLRQLPQRLLDPDV
jgi:mannose-1-phosphate guanylyltransferase